MAKRLTELLAEALAKSQTDEGRRALLEERDRLDAEAVQAAAQTPPEGVQEPPEVRPNRRIDPIFPVVQSVREAPEREAGRLAFGGIIEDRKSLPAQLPLLPTPEGPRVPILELSDWRGVPTMARGRGAPLDLRLAVGALRSHSARREGRTWAAGSDGPGAPRLPVPERLGAVEGLAADPGGALQSSGLCAPGRGR